MTDIESKQGGPSQAPERGPAWADDNDPTNPAETYPLTRTNTAENRTPLTGEGWRLMLRRRRKVRA